MERPKPGRRRIAKLLVWVLYHDSSSHRIVSCRNRVRP